MNELQKYYIEQAGTGLSGFRGIRYQRGENFFGRLLSGAVYPLLRFLGKNLLRTGANIASDLVDSNDFSKDNLKNISKKNVKQATQSMLEAAVQKMKGEGRKRKIKRSKVKNKTKSKRSILKRNKVKRNIIKGRVKKRKGIKAKKLDFLY